MMKKIIPLLVLALVAWNVFLTLQVKQLKQASSLPIPTPTPQHTNVHPDVSDIVMNSEESVVSVLTFEGEDAVSMGSGAIYKTEGDTVYIITNEHVVADGNHYAVYFSDDTFSEAELIGSDTLSDLALLKATSMQKIKPFKLGDSSALLKGEYVIAIGSPVGMEYQGSVSGGLISGLNRTIEKDTDDDGIIDWDVRVIQTDAPINPGNSGGPLINMNGELIGINSMKHVAEDVEGFGFALPINDVLTIVEQLEQHGQVVRPFMGVRVINAKDLSILDRFYYGIQGDDGLYAIVIVKGSPIEKAGMVIGDRLVSFDGQEVNDVRTLNKLLYQKTVGDEVIISYMHNEKEIQKTIRLK